MSITDEPLLQCLVGRARVSVLPLGAFEVGWLASMESSPGAAFVEGEF